MDAHDEVLLPPREKIETHLGCRVITFWKLDDHARRVEHVTLETPIDGVMASHRASRARAAQ